MGNSILFPILGALFGWGFYQGCMLLLCYPKKPIKIGKWSIQGLLPKCLNKMHLGLTDVFCQDLNLTQEVNEFLDKIDLQKELDPLFDKRIDAFFQTLIRKIPVATLLLKENLTTELKTLAKEEFYRMVPELKQAISQNLSNTFNLQEWFKIKISSTKIQNIIENNLYKTLFKESRHLAYFAVGLGCFFGWLELMVFMW